MVVHGPGGTPCSCLSLPTMYNVSRCRFLPFRQPTLFSYFRVPEECKDLWLRPNGLQWKHVKNLFICSKHFASKCFSPIGKLLSMLSFMAVGVNGSWRVPIGYFPTAGLNAQEISTLVRMAVKPS